MHQLCNNGMYPTQNLQMMMLSCLTQRSMHQSDGDSGLLCHACEERPVALIFQIAVLRCSTFSLI